MVNVLNYMKIKTEVEFSDEAELTLKRKIKNFRQICNK